MNYFNYFSEIEELFIRRRGRNLLLSPLDWALIETWQERSVPLHVILGAIETVFDSADKQPARKKTIKSLTYCRDEIEAQYTAWLERQVGKNGGEAGSPKSKIQSPKPADSELFPVETIAAHIEKVSAKIQSARRQKNGERLGDIADEILKQLEKLKHNLQTTAENPEQSLEKLDASIDAALLSGEFATDDLKSEIKKQLAGYRSKMEADVYQRTFDLMLVKRLRENSDIPRLSLFHL